ncbi:hypothetical protein CSB09_02915 [Candidatus Gracilibacteria bacterium]|nr:MAG: hypothetical protein CSB09_02915 [Candidatus Gracilibacteria bacterium]
MQTDFQNTQTKEVYLRREATGAVHSKTAGFPQRGEIAGGSKKMAWKEIHIHDRDTKIQGEIGDHSDLHI